VKVDPEPAVRTMSGALFVPREVSPTNCASDRLRVAVVCTVVALGAGGTSKEWSA
jgi:hypothetical protein